MPKRDPKVGVFQHSLRDKPAILITPYEFDHALQFGRAGVAELVRYATAPGQTEVWLRYEAHYDPDGNDLGTARWQCQARIVHSKIVGTDGDGDFFAYRLTLALFGDEERTDRS